jgi:CRISPR/Cas system CMR subunit Cmr4 (Cas7 group RAMP superfamily)
MSNQELQEFDKTLKYRKVAQIVIEATTPLKTASGESDATIDTPVLKDWNNLPMIQGSSMAGVLRDSVDDNLKKNLFGEKYGCTGKSSTLAK